MASRALAGGVPITQATDEQKEAAQAAYADALAKVQAKKHEEALAGFRASHDIVASPNSRLMIARQLVELGRLGEAYREVLVAEQLAVEAAQADPKYNDTLTQAKAEVAELKAKVGFVRIDPKGRPGGEVVIEGRSIPASEVDAPVAVNPGEVEVMIRTSGGVQTRKATVAAGAEASVSFEPPPVAPPQPTEDAETEASMHPFDGHDGQRITAIVCGVLGVAGMATFGVFGGLNVSKYRDLRDQCPDGRCPAELEEEIDTGRTYQTAANVSVVVGAVFLAAGAALFIPTMVGEQKPSKVFALGVGPGFVSVRGSFE